MKTIKNYLFLLLTACMLFTACSKDDDDVVTKNKEGILLVTFGSSYPGPKDTFKNIDTQVKNEYPNMEVRWAYTSHIIRNKLLENDGLYIDSPIEALKKMKKDGYSKITVQSLHVIPGAEFNDLKTTFNEFAAANKDMKLSLGNPLMNTKEDMNELADCLVKRFKTQADAGDAIVFMGHGTHHEADNRYSQMQEIIAAKNANFIIGTVEGAVTLDMVINKIENLDSKTKIITISPLMSVAGDHANNDMAGTDKDSWKVILEAKKYTVKPILRGLGDYNDVCSIWIKHLKEAKARL